MIAGKYNIIKKISEGSFGSVFEGKNIRTMEDVAIKVELKKNDMKTLKMEAKIYQLLKEETGFPRLKWYGTNENINYLVIDLLGASLDDLVKEKGKVEVKEVVGFGIQMIDLLKKLHEKELIHRDIKPNNFLFARNGSKILHLIDMGFCKRYINEGYHMPPKILRHPIGTPNYVSINVHNNIEPSRRDDIESCIYVMVYMLNGCLSWEKLPFDKEMIEQKRMCRLKDECIPRFIVQMLNHVVMLGFAEPPNYKYLINILNSELHN